MADLVQGVAATVERHRMFERGCRVGVAVSGGADSVCLLHVLRQLAAPWQLCLTVLHLNHNLRGEESRADAEFVRSLAAGLGLPALIREATLPPGNVEQAGRDARLTFFRELVSTGRVDRVAVGHTRRDQAETVLFRFLRGAGTAGLSGIRPVTSDGIVRPLLETGREEIEAWLGERHIPWRDDSTNSSRAFARNRIRHELLPQLARDWNPLIEETLARTAEWAQAEEAYWVDELERVPVGPAPDPGRQGESTALVLDAATLRRLPVAVARRAIRRAIEHVKGDLRSIDFTHVESILTLAQSRSGSGAVQLPGLNARRSFDQIRLVPKASTQPAHYNYPIPAWRTPGPEALSFPVGPSSIYLELIEKTETTTPSHYVYNDDMGCLDWGRVSGSLVLRNWRAGDHFQPIGSAGPRTLKSLFQTARIPVWERAEWPVLADGSSVLWTRRFGVAGAAAVSASTRVFLRISESGTSAPASNQL